MMTTKKLKEQLEIKIETMMLEGQQEVTKLQSLKEQIKTLEDTLKKREGVVIGYRKVIEMIEDDDKNDKDNK